MPRAGRCPAPSTGQGGRGQARVDDPLPGVHPPDRGGQLGRSAGVGIQLAMAAGVVLPSFEPAPVGAFPAGASAWGVHDLVGNGWEWTSIRPGISVRPPQSIILAVASLIGLAEISRIVSPSTTSSWPPRNSPAPGSSISKFLKW